MRGSLRSITRFALEISAAVALAAFAAPAAFAEISVTVTPSLAPNYFGSPSWNGYAANAVYAIQHGLASYGDPGLPTYYYQADHFAPSEAIATAFPSWMGRVDPGTVFGPAYGNERGNRMHFGLHILATGGEAFELDDLSFNSVSAPNPGLNWHWDAGPWTFTEARIGIGADGHTYTSGSSTGIALTEFIYVGSGNTFEAACPGCTLEEQQDALLAAAFLLRGVTYTGTYTVVDAAGQSFSGAGAFTIDPVPEPSSIVLLGAALFAATGVLRRRLRTWKGTVKLTAPSSTTARR